MRFRGVGDNLARSHRLCSINRYRQGASKVSRNNILYLIVGALIVGVAIMGYQLYQDRHQPEGLNINVGPNGLSIEGKGK
jgi:hypothetical protein